MFASAQIIFVNTEGDGCLTWLFEALPKHVPFPCSRTEWRGFSTVIPQMLVETSPVPLTIQVDDDAEYVPEEIQELADDLEKKIADDVCEQLRKCNARLDIMTATPNEPQMTEDAIVVVAQTDLDPAASDVNDVIRTLARLVDGFIHDCVNGRILCPGVDDWAVTYDGT